MNKTTFMSRSVNEDGYYEIEFNTLGIHLTQIKAEEINYIPVTHYAYMSKGQYIEGTGINDWKKKPVLCYLNTGQLTTEMDEYKRPQDLNHVCQYKEYHGLFEVDRICKICGKSE